MKTVGVFTPNFKDATSFYRAWGPWSHLKEEINIIPLSNPDPTWVDFSAFDLFFIHRPFSVQHVNMIKTSKDMGIPTWVDFDDDLFNVHHSNNNHYIYDNDGTRRGVIKACKLADVVTVSTDELLNIYGPLSTRCEKIPNKLPEHMLGSMLKSKITTLPRKAVLWRGTPHHEMNLHYYQGAFHELMRNNPDWVFFYYGHRPWYIMEKSNPGQTMHLAKPQILDYLKDLQNVQAAIQVVPLLDHPFNRAKSSIAYLESAGMAGSVCVAPDMSEWQDKTGIVHYKPNDLDSFVEVTQGIMNMRDSQRYRLGRMAREHVVENETLSSVKSKRLQIIRELT